MLMGFLGKLFFAYSYLYLLKFRQFFFPAQSHKSLKEGRFGLRPGESVFPLPTSSELRLGWQETFLYSKSLPPSLSRRAIKLKGHWRRRRRRRSWLLCRGRGGSRGGTTCWDSSSSKRRRCLSPLPPPPTFPFPPPTLFFYLLSTNLGNSSECVVGNGDGGGTGWNKKAEIVPAAKMMVMKMTPKERGRWRGEREGVGEQEGMCFSLSL